MSTARLYHNPKCSKSRAALALLEDRRIDVEIVRYLETPPDAAELRTLADMLGGPVRDLVRTGEAEYRDLGLDHPTLEDGALLAALAANPRLIQRPILVLGGRAVVGRPPERVLELLGPRA